MSPQYYDQQQLQLANFALHSKLEIALDEIRALQSERAKFQSIISNPDGAALLKALKDNQKLEAELNLYKKTLGKHEQDNYRLKQEIEMLKNRLNGTVEACTRQEYYINSVGNIGEELEARRKHLYIAEQEINRLQNALGFLQSNQSRENAVLNAQLATLSEEYGVLKQENIFLNDQMMRMFPVSYHQDRDHLSASSNSMSIMVERPGPGAFENMILSLPARTSSNFSTPVDLPILRFRLDEYYNSSEYFQQFLPFIQEEIRASIAAQIEKISTQQLRPFTASFNPEKKTVADNYAFTLSCRTQNLPKLEHRRFQYEAVFVVTNKIQTSENNKNVKESLQGFLAIASYDDFRKNNPKEAGETHEAGDAIFSLILLKDQYENNANYWQTQKNILEIHWLHGLVPAAREYAACVNPAQISLESQIVRGNLSAWPSDAHTNAKTETTREQVINDLQDVDFGLFCLQGPPGTGKTDIIVKLLDKLTRQNPDERILVCTPSNSAVQVVFERTQAQFSDMCMVLLANNSKVASDACMKNYTLNLFSALNNLHELNDISIEDLQQKTSLEYEKIVQKLQTLNQHSRKAFVKTTTKNKIADLEKYFLEKMHNLKNKETLLEEAELRSDLEASVSHLKNNLHFLEYFLVQCAQVVFTTLTGSGRDFLKKQIPHFKHVIIDEAAQTTIPATLIPLLGFNPDVCLLVGDQKQLPATIISNDAKNRGYSTSLFASLVESTQPQPYKMLTTQYRMHQEICRWPSQQYYGGALKASFNLLLRTKLFPFEEKSVLNSPTVFFNISGKEVQQGHSFINEKEALAIVATVSHLILKWGIKFGQIGIISFYAAQVNKILECLKNKFKELPTDLTVSTVDGFQGDERDIMMLSTVRTQHNSSFFSNPNRICVSTTRGKHHFYLFAMKKSIIASGGDLASYSEHTTVVPEEELFSEINRR